MASQRAAEAEDDSFFSTVHPPAHFEASLREVRSFVERCAKEGRRVALVTSGGTTVPLERKMVRFLDNFSAGTRGAISAEWFLRRGFAVIFLHRQFSLQPFARHYRHADTLLLDMFVEERRKEDGTKVERDDRCINHSAEMDKGLRLKPGYAEQLARDLGEYNKYKHDAACLLSIHFYTVADYLFLLQAIGQILSPLGRSALLYLAAAVSDFYLPESQLAEHKIQSDDGTLTLRLEPVPKVIRPLVKRWCPEAVIVSFKLETDSTLLLEKARKALKKYQHHAVVANLLTERRQRVTLVRAADEGGEADDRVITATDREEIEEKIVDCLIALYYSDAQ